MLRFHDNDDDDDDDVIDDDNMIIRNIELCMHEEIERNISV